MKTPSLIALAAGLLLGGTAMACTDCAEHAHAHAPAKVAATPAAVEADGMIAVRDPVTGQLRAPTAEELSSLQARSQAQKSSRVRALSTSESPLMRTNTRGAIGARPGPENISYSVVTRNADGTLSSACVQGQDRAEAIVNGQTAKNSDKE